MKRIALLVCIAVLFGIYAEHRLRLRTIPVYNIVRACQVTWYSQIPVKDGQLIDWQAAPMASSYAIYLDNSGGAYVRARCEP